MHYYNIYIYIQHIYRHILIKAIIHRIHYSLHITYTIIHFPNHQLSQHININTSRVPYILFLLPTTLQQHNTAQPNIYTTQHLPQHTFTKLRSLQILLLLPSSGLPEFLNLKQHKTKIEKRKRRKKIRRIRSK